MDYEQFFPPMQNDNCVAEHKIIGLVTVLTCLYVTLDCLMSCVQNKRVYTLETENKTLKSIILNSVDRTLIRMMKNGNNSETSEED